MLITVNTGKTVETTDNNLVLYPLFDFTLFIRLLIVTIILGLVYFMSTFILSFDPLPTSPVDYLVVLFPLLIFVISLFMLLVVFISLLFLKKAIISESEIKIVYFFTFIRFKSEIFQKQDFILFFSHTFESIMVTLHTYQKVVKYFFTLLKDETEEENEIGIILRSFLGLPSEQNIEFLKLLNKHGILFDTSSSDFMAWDYNDFIEKEKEKLPLEFQNLEPQ